jgi:hypothetical protein
MSTANPNPVLNAIEQADLQGVSFSYYVVRLPDAEKDRVYAEMFAHRKRWLKGPKDFKITVPWEVAKAIRANPESVRIKVETPEGATALGWGRLMELVEVCDDE